MRRDYFTCVFLLYIAASLSFVCLLPSYFVYGAVIPREIGLFERLVSLAISIIVILVVPILAAIRKKFWVTLGAATFGLLAYLPSMILSKMDSVLSGSGANTIAVIEAFFLKAIYIMVNAPYVGISKLLGNKFALTIPKLILPVSLITYVAVQLFRFYRNAYLAEQLSPSKDVTHKVERPNVSSRKPEILGTVISAPKSSSVDARTTANQAPKPTNPQQVTTNKTEEQKAINGRNPESVKRVTAPPETPLLEKSNVIYVEPRPTPNASSSGETKVINLGGPINSNDRPDVIYLGQAPEKKNPEQ